MPKKIVSVVGARPNFIKCAPLSRRIRELFDEVLIHTGQHYDYSLDKVFFEELGIPRPDYHLGVGSAPHGAQTGRMLEKIEEVLLKEKPELVLVYGDTNSTLAGALAASKLGIKIAHVEAGLRSFDRRMPEEINRVLTDHCSDLLFCSIKSSVNNLKREGITRGVHLSGDVMADSMRENLNKSDEQINTLEEYSLEPRKYILATIHRQENTESAVKLKNIAEALCEFNNVIFPCHPRTKAKLKSLGLWEELDSQVKIIEPVGYLQMLALEKNAEKIVTDSGGMQKEAYILGKPCVTIRENTEWLETLKGGWNILVKAEKESITRAIKKSVPRSPQDKIFQPGASDKIVKTLKRELK